MPLSTDSLKMRAQRSRTPRIRATTNVLRFPLVMSLIKRATYTVTPTTKSVPTVDWNAAGSLDLVSVPAFSSWTGASFPARYSSLQPQRLLAQDDRRQREADQALERSNEDGKPATVARPTANAAS